MTAIIQAPPCPIFGPPVTQGSSINSMGHVGGFYDQCSPTIDEAFVWTPEDGLFTIPRPAGVYSSMATELIDDGLVCGEFDRTGLGFRAFVYDLRTHEYLAELEPLPGGRD